MVPLSPVPLGAPMILGYLLFGIRIGAKVSKVSASPPEVGFQPNEEQRPRPGEHETDEGE